MHPIYLGITGQAGAGKSTVAAKLRLFAAASGVDLGIVPFAKPLKDFARKLGWNGEKDERGRRLLQLLGTEVGRECIHPDIWVDKWEEAATALPGGTIADDCRFDNEVERVRELGGMIVRVTGRGLDLGGNAAHASESVPTFADLEVENCGDENALHNIMGHVWEVVRFRLG